MKVCIVAEAFGEKLLPISFELLTRALELAPGDIGAVVVSKGLPDSELKRLVAAGADVVLSYEGDFLDRFRPEPYSAALVSAVKEYQPEILIGGATTAGRTLLPYAAMKMQTGLTADCTQLAIDSETGLLLQTRPAIGGNIMATIKTPKHRPQMATIRPHSTPPAPETPGRSGAIRHIAAPTEWADSGISLISGTAIDEKQELSSAKRIVAVGRGIKKPENLPMVRELASLLGAAVGATREVVDRGWLPYSCQIGLSGRTVTPDLYIGLGVSGAIQHLAGMQTAKRIIAVNTDSEAQIFSLADLAIVGSLHDVVPKLIEKIRNGGEI
ncbi:MAG: electron transfer flavoprotein subunit alpha/FixB family protein [Victivallales bacterium]|nr:electron transfer flavoprotein subunit alpha/FixB family protein [Victivallales bacterium]